MTLKCRECEEEKVVPLSAEQLKRIEAGELIQNVAPEVDEGLRELLISGFCGKCFDAIFDGPEEEDEAQAAAEQAKEEADREDWEAAQQADHGSGWGTNS